MSDALRARTGSGLIDVHAHYFSFPTGPSTDGRRERELAAGHFLGSPVDSPWSTGQAIEFMDRRGIDVQLLSSPYTLRADAARTANDLGAAFVAEHPTRFGLLANLPLGDVDDAVAEIGRALDELGADGFVITTNHRATYLGDPRFEPVFAELNRRRATVFLHPVAPAGFDATACGRPGPVLEFPFDTARTVVDMLYARVFLTHPDFTLILSHAGGALPGLAARIASTGVLPWVPNPSGVTAEEITAQLAGLYYDTALAGTPHSLLPLLQVTTADHVLFGSDFPPGGLGVIDGNIEALAATSVLTTDELGALASNAMSLFPALEARLARRT